MPVRIITNRDIMNSLIICIKSFLNKIQGQFKNNCTKNNQNKCSNYHPEFGLNSDLCTPN